MLYFFHFSQGIHEHPANNIVGGVMKKILMELKIKAEHIQSLDWVESVAKGYSGAGLTFEHLLGKEKDRDGEPDYKGIEIKTKYAKFNQYVALFHATPNNQPLVIKRMQEVYGYPDQDYPQFKVFNVSIYGNKIISSPNKYKLKIEVNRKLELISLVIFDVNDKVIDYSISWSFDLLREKLEKKFKYLFFIRADRKWDYASYKVYFRYTNFKFYMLKDFSSFVDLLEKGDIKITFHIGVVKSGYKFGHIHDHGTAFEIHQDSLDKLFNNIDELI